MTVILLTCSYNDQEFVRIGYYVNTEYGDPDLKALYDASLLENATAIAPDASQHVESLIRSVLVEKPRVTRFNIKWLVIRTSLLFLVHLSYLAGTIRLTKARAGMSQLL